jgi:predicted DNA-binding transcriptional regulator
LDKKKKKIRTYFISLFFQNKDKEKVGEIGWDFQISGLLSTRQVTTLPPDNMK